METMTTHTPEKWEIEREGKGGPITAIGPISTENYYEHSWLVITEEQAELVSSIPVLVHERDRLKEINKELVEALEQAYLQINILVEEQILQERFSLAIKTDSLRAKMRNALASALNKDCQELQDNVHAIALNEALRSQIKGQ